jgi:hypothetical protein
VILERAKQKDILFTTFREPDIDDALTAIALEPGEASRKLCSSLPLAFKPNFHTEKTAA